MTRFTITAYLNKSYLEQICFKILLFMTSWRLVLGRTILQIFLLRCETDFQILPL